MTDAWNERADALKAVVAEKLAERTDGGKITDATVYDFVMCAQTEYLANLCGGEFAALPRNEQHAVVAVLIDRLHPTDGIKTFPGDRGAVWLWAGPFVDGRLADAGPRDWRWIRLDTITEVVPLVVLGVGEDVEEWQYALAVTATGGRHHATATRFRGSAVKEPMERLLRLVGESLRR